MESAAAITDRDERDAADDLIVRYVRMRLTARTAFGPGYYGWPLATGLLALMAAAAAVGWLARLCAADAGRRQLQFGDVADAIGRVDATAGRSPALGTAAERLRLSYLVRDGGLIRLVRRYGITE